MRKKKVYLFKGVKVKAYSKDEVLRAHNLPGRPRYRAMILRLKPQAK